MTSAPPLARLTSPPTRRQAVVERLRATIVAGDLEPGALLREAELSVRLGVSPTPIREALVELAAEGLVEVETHRLKRVSPIHPRATRDLVQVQGLLWRQGYVWAFANIGEAERRLLAEQVAGYASALEAGQPLQAIQAGQAFHTIVIAASGNTELLRVTLDRRALIARFILRHGRESVSPAGLKQHRAMLSAFTRGEMAPVLAGLERLSAKLIAQADALIAEADGV